MDCIILLFFEIELRLIVVASTDMIMAEHDIMNSSVIISIVVVIIGCWRRGATELGFHCNDVCGDQNRKSS